MALARMKHAGADTLRRMDDLLGPLRELGVFREPRPGYFYLKGRAFMHFHEDASGLFADVRLSQREFSRFAVDTPEQRLQLLRTVQQTVSGRLQFLDGCHGV